MNLESPLQTTRSEQVSSVIHLIGSSDKDPFIKKSESMMFSLHDQVLDFLLEGAGGGDPSKLPIDGEERRQWTKMLFSRDRWGRNALQTFVEEKRIDVARRFLDRHISTTPISK